MRLQLRDYIMGVSVALTWGMGIVFAKGAIEHFPPILLMALRFAVTALLMVWFVRPPFGQIWKIFGIAVISAAIQYSLTFTGLKGLDASVAALVVQLEVPFLVLLGAVLLKEQPGLRKWLGIAVAFIGVGLIAGEPRVGGAWWSMLLVVGGAFTWAVGQVMVRTLRGLDGLTTMTWVAICATPQLFMMSLIFEQGHVDAIKSADMVVWGAVIYLGIIMNAFGYGLWYTLVRRHPVSRVAPFLLLLPVFSVIGGVLFLGEALSWQTIIGGAVVLLGVSVIVFEPEADEADDYEEDEFEDELMAPALAVYRHVWPDGSHYEGEWQNGSAHGYGVMIWSARSPWPGDRYEGQWLYGRMDGEGTYMRADGTRLDGPWRGGLKH